LHAALQPEKEPFSQSAAKVFRANDQVADELQLSLQLLKYWFGEDFYVMPSLKHARRTWL
jgi:hypothetical protein